VGVVIMGDTHSGKAIMWEEDPNEVDDLGMFDEMYNEMVKQGTPTCLNCYSIQNLTYIQLHDRKEIICKECKDWKVYQ
jgi:hypothetical protein